MCDLTDHASMALALEPQSSALAREFVASAVCGTHCGALVRDDAVLLTSEVVTNAAVHGGPPIELTVDCNGVAIEITVRDGSHRLPVPRVAADHDEAGRGLALVAELSEAWGVEVEGDGRKAIWFRLSV